MRAGVVGLGVIGKIYGWVLAEAGHDVVHFVRSGRAATLGGGAELCLLDARGGETIERQLSYRPELVEGLDGVGVDVVLASVLATREQE